MRRNQILLSGDDDIATKIGTILSINAETRRADVELEDETVLTGIEFFYHCMPDDVENAYQAFTVNDKVIIAERKYIIGFEDLKPRPCAERRFFAKVNRGTSAEPVYKYYWLLIKAETVDVVGVFNTELVSEMSATSEENNHVATKSFMLGSERWCAGPHMLVKDRIRRFNPLGYPKKSIEFYSQAVYPDPMYCYGDGGSPEGHPCPPNRFYCDVDNRMMVWYSCYIVIDPMPPYQLIHYCFGVILTASENMIEECYTSPEGTKYYTLVDSETGEELVKSFYCHSQEITGDFEALWSCRGTLEHPILAGPEVPTDMMTEVNSIENGKMEVVLPWGFRPIKVIIDLTEGGGHTYEEMASCNHWYWTKEGFEQKLFVEFDQEDNSGAPDAYIEDSGGGPGSDCVGKNEAGCLAGCGTSVHGNVNNIAWFKDQRIDYSSTEIESWIKTHIFDETQNSRSAELLGRDIYERREYEYEYCYWNSFAQECLGPYESYGVQQRDIEEATRQKIVDSIEAEWSSPNVAFFGSIIRRRYAENVIRQWPGVPGYNWSGSYAAAFEPCFNRDVFGDCSASVIAGGVCFYNYPFPNPDWADDVSVVNQFLKITPGYEWRATQNAYEYSKTPVVEFKADEGIVFDEKDAVGKLFVNRTFYLDDRAAKDSHGMIVAGEGVLPGAWNENIQDFNPDIPDYWKIYWVPFGGGKYDITGKVLAALDCEIWQLCGIGLI